MHIIWICKTSDKEISADPYYNISFVGMWYIILKFVNICGVISNGFLIGFTSSWCRHCDVYERLWIVVGFEVGYVFTDSYSRYSIFKFKNDIWLLHYISHWIVCVSFITIIACTVKKDIFQNEYIYLHNLL